MRRLLLVEDDQSLGSTLKERLQKEGYQVDWCRCAQDSMRFICQQRYDLVVLDVGLPDGSGFELAQQIRNTTSAPFIFVTAQTSAAHRLQGYELGAEEYIPKPFHLKELLLRVRHVLENHALKPPLVCGRIIIDFESRAIIDNQGRREALAQKDYEILRLLIEKSPAVVSRDEILDRVWGEDQFPSQRTIDNVILRLRQLLGHEIGQNIKTIRGVGYQWLDKEVANGE